MRRFALQGLAALALAALALPMGTPAASAQAIPVAQQVDNPIASFFRQLFGGGRQMQAPPAGSREQPAQRHQQAPQARGTPQQAAPARQREQRPAPVEKDPDAQRVLVVGDFFAAGLRDGLEESFADSRMVAVDGRSNPSSGLVRQDYFDWPATISAMLADPDMRVDVAVVMIGGNDRQPLSDLAGEHAPRSERWRELYAARVDGVIRLFHERGVPVYWVGLPPVESARLSQDYAYFNDLYRERAYRAGAGFVDIWNSFVDEDGRYSSYGPDLNGEVRQLRRDDGLHFNNAGNRKLAHFVARDIRRDVERDGGLEVAMPRGPLGPQPFRLGVDERETGVGEIVTLTGASRGAAVLAGGPERAPAPPEDSAYYRAILLGESNPPPAGRSDDFSWPRDGADTAEN